MQLMDLSHPIIERFARLLDGDSLPSFALAHPRLQHICRNMESLQLNSSSLSEHMAQFNGFDPLNVRVLNLSNCQAHASRVKAFITQCRNLTELNVVNSRLCIWRLLLVLNQLKKLENLSFTCNYTTKPEAAVAFLAVEANRYPSIRRIYVETIAVQSSFCYLTAFVNVCHGVEWLHVCGMRRAVCSIDVRHDLGGFREEIHAQRWEKYQTVIVTCMMGWPSMDLLKLFGQQSCLISKRYHLGCIFKNCPRWPDILSDGMKDIYIYERGNINEECPKMVLMPEKLSYLNQAYSLHYENLTHSVPIWHYGEPRGLKISGPFNGSFSGTSGVDVCPPAMGSLPTLVELDLTQCHGKYSVESWSSLVSSSPSIEALAVPTCFQAIKCSDSFPYFEFSHNCITTLQRLKLKKLYVEAGEQQCGTCSDGFTALVGADLHNFKYLEELTLHGVWAGANFFKSTANPSYLKIVKLTLKFLKSLDGLKNFFTQCRNLKHFKLKSFDLPLHSYIFWEALSESNLKQLCLSSKCSEAIDVEMLQLQLVKLFRSLEVLHIHGKRLRNRGAIHSLVQHTVEETNRVRKSRYLGNAGIFIQPEVFMYRYDDNSGYRRVDDDSSVDDNISVDDNNSIDDKNSVDDKNRNISIEDNNSVDNNNGNISIEDNNSANNNNSVGNNNVADDNNSVDRINGIDDNNSVDHINGIDDNNSVGDNNVADDDNNVVDGFEGDVRHEEGNNSDLSDETDNDNEQDSNSDEDVNNETDNDNEEDSDSEYHNNGRESDSDSDSDHDYADDDEMDDIASEYNDYGRLWSDLLDSKPGRNICFPVNFIAKIKPLGWHFD